MADLPTSTATQTESGGAIGIDKDLICVMSCTSSGTANAPTRVRNHADLVTSFGGGEGVSFLAHYLKRTGKSALFCKVATATAASIGPVDTKGVTGSSVITFTGTPVDEEDLVVEVVTGGTIGTAGIVIRISRDGGRTWAPNVRLGTAVLYAIPSTGVTVNFAAGTLVADDYATAHCVPAMWDSTNLGLAFDALAAGSALPGIILICGDIPDRNTLDAVNSEISGYETTVQRDARVIVNVRDFYPDAVKQGTANLTTDQATKKYTRASGSFITDGFKEKMTVTWAGFVNSASNGTKTIVTLTATEMVVSEAIGANEAGVASTTCVGVETKAAWRTALQAIIGTTPTTEAVEDRTHFFGGRGRRISPYDKTYKSRPAAWWLAMRYFEHDLKTSPAKVADGPLDGVVIHDPDGQLEEHDERVDGGLLAMRMGCLRTFDRPSGVYIALPLTLDTDNAPMSRGPVGRVADLVSTIVRQEGTMQLGGDVLRKSDGTIKESEARRIEGVIETRIKSEERGPEGKRWSSVKVTIDRSVVLVTGARVPIRTSLQPLFYIEGIDNTIEVIEVVPFGG